LIEDLKQQRDELVKLEKKIAKDCGEEGVPRGDLAEVGQRHLSAYDRVLDKYDKLNLCAENVSKLEKARSDQKVRSSFEQFLFAISLGGKENLPREERLKARQELNELDLKYNDLWKAWKEQKESPSTEAA
jgi:hypothetical protein